ncbi:MAG: hypothetical protein KGD68_10010 [Candidatus Lokiarchaeota archaeon]|nr:hypothetical protein [Candidatus Lokiarchaeota archaeon]
MNWIIYKTKTSILSFTLLCIILIGAFSTSISASTTYQLTLTKGTDEFVVDLYNDTDWKTTVDPSLTPRDWFEGEANVTNAKSKITLKGWTPNTWGMYDVLISIFMPEYFSFGEILALLIILDLHGYNEANINASYTSDYDLWYGLRAVWNYTTNDYEENPSNKDILNMYIIHKSLRLQTGIIILQNPLDFKTMLDDYNALATELNGNPFINTSAYFPIVSADDFLWQLALNGLAIAEPQTDYLEALVSELGCENASVSGSTLIFERYGLTNYTVEISYGEKGMMSSFTVKDIGNTVIYQITSSNSEWLFYLLLIIVSASSVVLIVYVVLRNRKHKR